MKRRFHSFAIFSSLLLSSSAGAEPLSAKDAVRLAVTNNPSLRAAVHDLAAAEEGVKVEAGVRLPTFFAGAGGGYNERFNAARAGVVRNLDRNGNVASGVRYRTPVGTDLEVGVQSNIAERTTLITPAGTDTVAIGPNTSGELFLSARQPLLRGAGTDAVLAPLRQARAAQTQSQHERDRFASALVLDVLTAYWELWYAERALAVQEEGEKLGQQQVLQTRRRAEELGSASRTDVLRFSAELAGIREALSQARAVRQARAIELGRLLGMSPRRAQLLSVVDVAPPAASSTAVEALSARAQELSSELSAMEAQVEVARQRVLAASAADRLQLDAFASGAMAGLWGKDELPGLTLPGGRPVFAVLVGLELEVPLGRSQFSADAARARAQLWAAEARLQALSESIEAQVASLHAELALSQERVALAEESVTIAEELAEAERRRLELGTATTAELVLAQQSFREFELRRLRAVVDQAAARFRLDHQIGALLPSFVSEPS